MNSLPCYFCINVFAAYPRPCRPGRWHPMRLALHKIWDIVNKLFCFQVHGNGRQALFFFSAMNRNTFTMPRHTNTCSMAVRVTESAPIFRTRGPNDNASPFDRNHKKFFFYSWGRGKKYIGPHQKSFGQKHQRAIADLAPAAMADLSPRPCKLYLLVQTKVPDFFKHYRSTAAWKTI